MLDRRRLLNTVERHRRLLSVITMTLAVLVGSAGAAIVVLGGQANPVTVRDAVNRYRAAQAAAPPSSSQDGAPTTTSLNGDRPTAAVDPTTIDTQPADSGGPVVVAALPEPGVYSYATTGSEEVGVPGSHRDFPSQTTITVTPQDCGVDESWQPFTQHGEDNLACAQGDRVRLVSFATSITFYGQTDAEHFSCDPAATFGSTDATPGQTWNFTCTTGTTTATSTATLNSLETLTVGNTPVPTLHVHVTTTLTGQQRGTTMNDYWFATANSLLIRNTGETQVKGNGSFGTADYHEQYELELQNLTPQR